MAFPSNTVLTAGSILKVQKAGTNRTLPSGTITVATAGAASGATSIPVTAVTALTGLTMATGDVVVQQGETLTFDSSPAVTATLTADLKVGDTTISVEPISGALVDGDAAVTNGLLRVLGGDSIDFNMSDNEVSTRGFEQGLFDDARKTMIGAELPFSGSYRIGDPSFNQVIIPGSLSADEIYYYYQTPDGRYKSGYAFIKGYTETGALDNIVRYSFSIRAVGTITRGEVA